MKKGVFVCCILFTFALIGCNDRIKSKGESALGRADSLFYGVQFGMSDKQFFDHCFVLNSEKIFFQSASGAQVTCTLTKGFDSPVIFYFFPDFKNQKIVSVNGSFVFERWAPFQPQYSAGKLMKQVIDNMQEWYGGSEFKKIETNTDCVLGCFEKVDLNRRIVLQPTLDDQKVVVFFEDLRP